jgi:ankyrin repeat protein
MQWVNSQAKTFSTFLSMPPNRATEQHRQPRVFGLTRRIGLGIWVALNSVSGWAAPPVQPVDEINLNNDKDPLESFFEAIRNDRIDMVRRWLQRGMDVNSFDARGDPILLIAVRHGSSKVIADLLAAQQVRVDALNRVGETPLMIAALRGDLVIARRLVELGAQVNRPGWTPLHYAATGGHVAMTRWLLEESAYIDADSPNGTTPLMMAARQGRQTVVELLISEGADPTARNEAGFTVTDYLDRNGLLELARRAEVAARAFRKQSDLPTDDREPK